MRWDLDLGRLYAVLLMISVLTTGCIQVGPDYARSPVDTPANWLEAQDPRLKTTPAERRDWWEVFKDSTPDKLINAAYQQNLPLQAAGVQVLEARAQLGVTIGERYPQTQQAVGNRQCNRLSERTAQTISGISHYHPYQIGLTASWELDFWGRFRRAVESADDALLATLANYDNTLVSLTADVATHYVLIRTAEKRLDIARRHLGDTLATDLSTIANLLWMMRK